MEKLKTQMPNIVVALLFTIVLSVACNMVGYDYGLVESLPGMIILALICLVGYLLSFVVPVKKISAVLWISVVAILVASPISPVSEQIIFHVNNISLNAVVTPILAYAGVIIGKDWGAFKQVGVRGIIVSIFVIVGTFLISGLMGDFFMNIFS
ncbi:hypothetical protein O6R05_02930 [Peptoniphilus equinus]|uniref:DUF340 domain-containing protein n=1 Tax=Peptoniphilus equinus TaxID=3016343 RepID=A0ABY7QWQ7_9FIRM|nr:hypothetical protein [Peptoniphilus equinus]WBW50515.1 hypothetical protein O6R05_02930 [Peptoniphilus equinus]